MFTGIVQQVGHVDSIQSTDYGVRLRIDSCGWGHQPKPGESIAVNGCCLTLAEDVSPSGIFSFDVIRQTLRLTNLGDLRVGSNVNLEHAVTPSSLLGGHIVQGHVDGCGVVTAVNDTSMERRLTIDAPPQLADWFTPQGSVALDGVSLTIASCENAKFDVALIPTTIAHTTLGTVQVGARVNIEADCIAKIVVGWLERHGAAVQR
ncbi:MAG TPA: riboflavin synthase [Phycisphaerales bacterium]|nr:riboflavin synthase [Phycisphaerales bacterium]